MREVNTNMKNEMKYGLINIINVALIIDKLK